VDDDALMVDMSLMRGVWVDPGGRVARAQAGCVLGDVDRETQLHGLSAVLGFVSNTGIAGLTLGGGFGYLTQKYGWTSDNVRAMEVVTADGQLARASEDENADLFWGLRGGGGNFGVVTGFDYELYPVGPEIVGGAVAWRGEDAPAVLELYRSVLEAAPPELTCVAALRIAPTAPWLPADVHGKPIVALFVCHTGPLDRAEFDVARIKSFGSPVGDILQRRTYVSQQSLIDATQPNGRRYYWKSEYLAGPEPGLLEAVIEHAGHIQSPHSAILLFPLGGALNALPQDHSAVGNRDARLVVNIAGAWDSPEDDEKNVEWARGAWRDIRPYSTGGTYLNFLTEEEGDERVRSALGSNYERLTQVKARWDPDNLFRTNKNIAPARAG
jgi:FAD/FMN-containing dehydrogenase